jgi:hypothetical protein
MATIKHALLIGWDPDVPNPMTPDQVRQGLAAAKAKVESSGHTVDFCFLRDDPSDIALIERALRAQRYDTIVVGAGIRLQAKHLLLFEKIINMIHRAAPEAAISFNTTPLDTSDAVLRWL